MRVVLIAAVTALLLTGCSGGDNPRGGGQVERLELRRLPSEMNGLAVRNEDVAAALERVRPSYVASAALVSFRSEDELVHATLQVNRFREGERYRTDEFRRTIVNQLGGSVPVETRMGERVVWRTSGTKQRAAMWFSADHMFLLNMRDDLQRPRQLIRAALELQP